MGANFSRYFVESPGNTILAANYNGEFDNILNNLTPVGIDDASVSLSAYKVVVDPGEPLSEVLPTSLAGELHRLRYMIKTITGKSEWYEDPDGPLPATPGVSVDKSVVIWSGTGGNSLAGSNVIIDDYNDMDLRLKTLTTSSTNTTFTANSVTDGDPWDLSEPIVGDIVYSGGNRAEITSINDAGDSLLTNTWIPSTPNNGDVAYVARKGTLKVSGYDVSVPVGTILDFWNGGGTLTMPSNFMACDGSTVTDPDSPLYNVTLPDLNTANGVFTIGSDKASHDTTLIGDTDHSVTVAAHAHSIPNHRHGLPDITYGISDTGPNPGTATYKAYDDGQGWSTASMITTNGGGNVEGQHYHDLGGYTDYQTALTTYNGGGHTVSILSRSLEVQKIIRIK